MVGLGEDEIVASRHGNESSLKATAALTFAKHILDAKGQITEAELSDLHNAGFSDGEIADTIAHVALNVFTNYFNIAAGVVIDFPKVSHPWDVSILLFPETLRLDLNMKHRRRSGG